MDVLRLRQYTLYALIQNMCALFCFCFRFSFLSFVTSKKKGCSDFCAHFHRSGAVVCVVRNFYGRLLGTQLCQTHLHICELWQLQSLSCNLFIFIFLVHFFAAMLLFYMCYALLCHVKLLQVNFHFVHFGRCLLAVVVAVFCCFLLFIVAVVVAPLTQY